MENKEIFAKNLMDLVKATGKSQNDLVYDLNLSQSTVSDWINAKKYPRIDKIQMIADYFGVLKSDLTEGKNHTDTRNKVEIQNNILYLNIPLYNSISCGSGIFVGDDVEEYIQISDRLLNPNKEYFAQIASGESMIGESINDGDLLVFEKTSIVENGQIGCFCVDDNIATCKKFYHDSASGIITLQPANSKHSPIIVTVENMGFHIVGKLSLVINKRD